MYVSTLMMWRFPLTHHFPPFYFPSVLWLRSLAAATCQTRNRERKKKGQSLGIFQPAASVKEVFQLPPCLSALWKSCTRLSSWRKLLSLSKMKSSASLGSKFMVGVQLFKNQLCFPNMKKFYLQISLKATYILCKLRVAALQLCDSRNKLLIVANNSPPSPSSSQPVRWC